MVAGLALAVVAALIHVYIFYMESIAWTSSRVRATFGLSEAEAAATKEMAFNQGFYNLFLAIVTGIGIVVYLTGLGAIGTALVLTGVGSMAAAALVLFVTSPSRRGAALKQGVVPLLGLMAICAAIALG